MTNEVSLLYLLGEEAQDHILIRFPYSEFSIEEYRELENYEELINFYAKHYDGIPRILKRIQEIFNDDKAPNGKDGFLIFTNRDGCLERNLVGEIGHAKWVVVREQAV
ncbi:MAG: hypothetical protein PHN45_02175 [Methylococcales bacterium]|nr:hypothetical protein [Methylococcales bacterium]